MQLPTFMTGRQSANSGTWFFTAHDSEREAEDRHRLDRKDNGLYRASVLMVLVETVSTGALNYELVRKWEKEGK